MSLCCGIVGLPNVGKSSLFNLLTKADIEASNYPFCTIESNVGIVEIPDSRLKILEKLSNTQKVIPAVMKFVDIAGLVQGASKGGGLGNKFLSHIRDTNAILHVVRCFTDPNITHVSGSVNPLADISVINMELIFADLSVVDKALDKNNKLALSGNKEAIYKENILKKLKACLESELFIISLDLYDDEEAIVSQYNFLTSKKTLYCINVSDNEDDVSMHDELTRYLRSINAEYIDINISAESEFLSTEDEEERKLALEMIGVEDIALNRLIRKSYTLLDLMVYFTVGAKEVRAWQISNGTHADKAAGVIHDDFERGFIRANVISYKDFVECGGENAAKEAGKSRLEGKSYIVEDGDIMHFRFNV